jgi:hypothetical protein
MDIGSERKGWGHDVWIDRGRRRLRCAAASGKRGRVGIMWCRAEFLVAGKRPTSSEGKMVIVHTTVLQKLYVARLSSSLIKITTVAVTLIL